jgi:hypothetical protein
MKRLVLVLLMIVPFSISSRLAYADKPTIERFPIHDEFVDDSCGFDVNIVVDGVDVLISYVDGEGVYHEFDAYPTFKATFTNLGTGESLTVSIAGPQKLTVYPDGSLTLVGTGVWAWGSNPETGDPGWFETSGHFVETVDAEGNQSFALTGRLISICDQL